MPSFATPASGSQQPQAYVQSIALTYYWDVGTLSWLEGTQPGGAAGGGLTDAELRASPVPVSGPLTDAQLRAVAVPVSGTVTASGPLTDAQLRAAAVTVKEAGAGTPAQTSVASSATTVSLPASNANRLGATIYNDSTSRLLVKLGASASSSSFTAPLAAVASGVGGYYEVPFRYTGAIDGIWDSANGNARITELTA